MEFIKNNIIAIVSNVIIVIVFGWFIKSNIITKVSIVVIMIAFDWFIGQAKKIKELYDHIEKSSNSNDILKSLVETNISKIAKTNISKIVASYKDTITIEVTGKKQTNAEALEFFSEFNVCSAYKINLRLLDTASGTLVGLGLLGTFLGLTLGIQDFDSSTAGKIQQSIQLLLSGMGTAFLTSLLGMSLSMVYTFWDKYWRNKLSKHLNEMRNKLDDLYFIDDRTLDDLYEQALAKSITNTIKEVVENEIRNLSSSLDKKLTYTNETGDTSTVGNAIREILTENQEQSKALKSFSTDLAIELNNGFDEVLSRQMQEKILPLMENVDTTTKAIVEHIDKMAETVSSPATDMMQSVVDDLKNSMQSIISEFSNGLSGSATAELENLALQLGTATHAMADFPKNMENISTTLQVTIEEVKTAISEISNTSATANTTAMQQMQEQITFATGSISNAIEQVKGVMSGISQSSQEQSNQMVSKLADAAEQMGKFLSGTISTLSTSVQQSVKDMTDDVNNKQASLIALQEDTTSQTKKLLDAFNTGLDRLEKMNDYIAGTMNGFKQAQGEITLSTGNLRTISSDMKLATEFFNKGQNDYAAKLAQLQTSSQHGIDQVTDLLKESGQLSEEYAQKFEVIKQGLGSIFAQLQSGLSEYSRTVKSTTDKYLSQYTSSLTQTTGALMSTIERQSEVTEMLNDTISRIKK